MTPHTTLSSRFASPTCATAMTLACDSSMARWTSCGRGDTYRRLGVRQVQPHPFRSLKTFIPEAGTLGAYHRPTHYRIAGYLSRGGAVKPSVHEYVSATWRTVVPTVEQARSSRSRTTARYVFGALIGMRRSGRSLISRMSPGQATCRSDVRSSQISAASRTRVRRDALIRGNTTAFRHWRCT